MEINNIQEFNAYTAKDSATLPADNTTLQNRNRKAAQTDINQENIQAAQQAFEVNITREARDLMAAEAETPAQEIPLEQNPLQKQNPTQAQNPGQDQNVTPTQNQDQEQKTMQVVNIVA